MAECIEREAVMQKFADHVKRSNNSDFASVPTWNQAVQIVEAFPAVDVRPVVHGKWKEDCTGAAICSVCGEYAFETSTHHLCGWFPNFCPNCGCAMEGEERKHE